MSYKLINGIIHDGKGCRTASLCEQWAFAEIERLRVALKDCAAGWDSGPTTVDGAARTLSVEFQRRMNVAATALSLTSSEGEGQS